MVEYGIDGYLFELDDHLDLAEKIIDLLKNEEKQKEFILKSKEKIREKFTLDKMIGAYDEYFAEILTGTA